MNKLTRAEMFRRLKAENPNPVTELEYNSTFELLIAVILSAQATDVGVNKATRPLYAVANTPETIYALGVDGLKSYIKTIGLFNTKAENVIKTCAALIAKHIDKRHVSAYVPGWPWALLGRVLPYLPTSMIGKF